jgi:exonuclease VII small subunit
MSNAKVISIIDAEQRAVAARFEGELVALRVALDAQLQPLEQIVERLEQRVRRLEQGGGPSQPSA